MDGRIGSDGLAPAYRFSCPKFEPRLCHGCLCSLCARSAAIDLSLAQLKQNLIEDKRKNNKNEGIVWISNAPQRIKPSTKNIKLLLLWEGVDALELEAKISFDEQEFIIKVG